MRESNQQARSTLPECFRGEGGGRSSISKQLTLNCPRAHYWEACWDHEEHRALLSRPGSGVRVCVWVCVKVPTVIITLWHSYQHRQALTHQLALSTCASISQQGCMHGHLLQTLLFHSLNFTHTHTHACARTQWRTHTQAFFSHSCVQISNRACWEGTNPLTGKD